MKSELKIDEYGNKRWYLNGEKHREDGPAVEWADGTKHWYLNGEKHREDGPAVEWADGSKHWYLNGERHREDGPAVEWASGNKAWYLNDEHINPKEHLIEPPKMEEEMIGLINEFKFVEIDNKIVFVKNYLKTIDWFYNKYRLLF